MPPAEPVEQDDNPSAADVPESSDAVLETEFETLAEDFINEDTEDQGAVTPAELEESPPAEETPKSEEPSEDAQEEAPPAEEPEPEPESAPEPEPEPEPEPQTQETQEEKTARAEQLQQRLEERYSIPEDQVELLQTNPEQVLPKMFAGMMVDITTAMNQMLQQHVPTLARQTAQADTAAARAEEKFFAQWKDLNDSDGRKAVQKIGQLYRQLYPDASSEDFIRDVGAQAMVSLRRPVQGVGTAPEPDQTPDVVPHTPAGIAGATPTGSGPGMQSENEFTVLAREILEDD
jgi:hypothetical protein